MPGGLSGGTMQLKLATDEHGSTRMEQRKPEPFSRENHPWVSPADLFLSVFHPCVSVALLNCSVQEAGVSDTQRALLQASVARLNCSV